MSRILAGGRMGIGLAAAAAMLAVGAGAERVPAYHSVSVFSSSPGHAVEAGIRRRLSRKQIEERNRRARRRREAARLVGRRGHPQRSPYKAAVNLLTNWQRKQWAGAGYPGQKHQDPDAVQPFIELRRPA